MEGAFHFWGRFTELTAKAAKNAKFLKIFFANFAFSAVKIKNSPPNRNAPAGSELYQGAFLAMLNLPVSINSS